jgi:perosamine synthetase
MTLLKKLVNATRAAIQSDAPNVPLHEPCFTGNEWKYLKECLDTGWVSSVGKYVDLFEQRLVDLTGAKYAVSVINGTAALQVCCQLVGVESGDEVLTPALSFIATANAIHYRGGVPHFVDCNRETLGVDPFKLDTYLQEISEIKSNRCFNKKTGRCIRALVVVHTYGHPAQLTLLLELCHKFKITLIEDAAESLGSKYKGKYTGTFGKVASLSFNGNKTITTGGGGAILTNDAELALSAKHLTTTAKLKHAWEYYHDQIGYNFRLPNLNAALGCAQLEQIDAFFGQKRALAQRYFDAFQDITEVELFKEPVDSESNYWLNSILFDPAYAEMRDPFLEFAHQSGLMVRPPWVLMHRLPFYQNCPRMNLEVSENIEKRLVNLPSSSQLLRRNHG